MAVKEIMKYDVFISYSSNDKIIADGVLNYLKKTRYGVLLLIKIYRRGWTGQSSFLERCVIVN